MITTGVACACAAVLVLVLPRCLALGVWWVRRPRLAIVAWLATLLLGAVALLVTLVSWLLPVPVWQRSGCEGCWSVLAFVVGCLGLLALVASLSRVVARGEQHWRHARRRQATVDDVAARSDRWTRHRGIAVVTVDDDSLTALSSSHRGGVVLVGSRLVDRLTADQLAAVVEHECAHVVGRHDLVRWIAAVGSSSFPHLRGARSFARQVHLMLELAADDRAAQVCGRESTASALVVIAEDFAVPGALMRAERLGYDVPALPSAA